MATEIFIPKMSDHMVEATIVAWLVDEGDAVSKGQPILEVETDKAVAEIESPADGHLGKVRPGVVEGVAVPVGETIAFVLATLDEEVPALGPLGVSDEGPAQTADARSGEPGPPLATELSHRDAKPAIRASPAARKAAGVLGIDLASVVGTGPEGRISEDDVRAHDGADSVGHGTWIELTTVQELTARRMVESVLSAPQFSVTRHLTVPDQHPPADRYSVTVHLVVALAAVLVHHPRVNGVYDDGRLRVNDEINVGVAVGTDHGLFVPVIRRANLLTPSDIDAELVRLRRGAVDQVLTTDDLTGGTFTLSNLGMFGVDGFTAIVNPPQAAILATGQVWQAPVAVGEGKIAVEPRLTATLTADHRALDGIQVARFLDDLAAEFEASSVDRSV